MCAGSPLSLETLLASLQAVVSDLSPAPEMQQYCRGTAQGLLLQALAPLLRRAERDLPPAVARLLQVRSKQKEHPCSEHTGLLKGLGLQCCCAGYLLRSSIWLETRSL